MTSVVAGIFPVRRKCEGLKYFAIIFLVLVTQTDAVTQRYELPATIRQSVTSHHSHTWQRSCDLWLCAWCQYEYNTDKAPTATVTEPRWLSLCRPMQTEPRYSSFAFIYTRVETYITDLGWGVQNQRNAVPRAADKTFVSSAKYPNRHCDPHILLSNGIRGRSVVVKWPGHKADHSL